MHYRRRDNLGFVDKVFVMREGGGEALGIVVYAHGAFELGARNRATRGRFVRDIRRLNRELRVLRRLIVHPDVRGCGLGHWLVRQTLPLVGTRFVECLAAMGAVHPVFEKAGMTRVGRCDVPRGRVALIERMAALGVDPAAPDFWRRIARSRRVRSMVERTIQRWVTRTAGARQYRLSGRDPKEIGQVFRQLIGEPPMYYLWDREREYPAAPVADERMVDGAQARQGNPERKTCEGCGERKDRHDPRG